MQKQFPHAVHSHRRIDGELRSDIGRKLLHILVAERFIPDERPDGERADADSKRQCSRIPEAVHLREK